MDAAAPERTESKRGFSLSPNFLPVSFSIRARAARYSSLSPGGVCLFALKKSKQVVVVMTKPVGTGKPMRVISQRLACLGVMREGLELHAGACQDYLIIYIKTYPFITQQLLLINGPFIKVIDTFGPHGSSVVVVCGSLYKNLFCKRRGKGRVRD